MLSFLYPNRHQKLEAACRGIVYVRATALQRKYHHKCHSQNTHRVHRESSLTVLEIARFISQVGLSPGRLRHKIANFVC